MFHSLMQAVEFGVEIFITFCILPVNLFIHLLIHLFTHLFIYLVFIYIFLYLFVYLYTYLVADFSFKKHLHGKSKED